MSRAIKPAATIRAEGKSHRTKAELEAREKGEQALLSGEKLKERKTIKNSPLAHEEFKRVSRLLGTIGKDDALYTAIVNRYCELYEEVISLSAAIDSSIKIIAKIKTNVDALEDDEASPDVLLQLAGAISKALSTLSNADSKVMAKRKMMLDIEKECCMTVSAALRTIPKTAEKTEDDVLLAALRGDD